MQEKKQEFLKKLPSVEEMLQQREIKGIHRDFPRRLILDSIKRVIDKKRKEILTSNNSGNLEKIDLSQKTIIELILLDVKESSKYRLKRVINATGVIIHTNLGRSILSKNVLDHISEISGSYSNLEYDLCLGKRGSRNDNIVDLLKEITSAESGLVVNNNAAAVLVSLDTLANGKEVIVSRGELVEIGGSFRIPDIMNKSSGILREVGTTNKTHLNDYVSAISENTGLILKVHRSNFKMMGFIKEVSLEELIALGKEKKIPVMEDLGSGNFIDLTKYGLEREPTVQESVRAGVDIVTFSGDKLLGGPQAGIILGKESYVKAIKKNPLHRAMRIDKMTLAGLEATLKTYLDEEKAVKEIPTLRMLTMPLAEIEERAKNLLERLKPLPSFDVNILDDSSRVGGGALPLQKLPTKVISLKPKKLSVDALEKYLRAFNPPILGRIYKEQFLFDVRTIDEEDFEDIIEALTHLRE